jgi:hypothetical protein
MLDLIAVVAFFSMFCLAAVYVSGTDRLKGRRS